MGLLKMQPRKKILVIDIARFKFNFVDILDTKKFTYYVDITKTVCKNQIFPCFGTKVLM